ncbi:LysR family transcriptional regulator [Sphingomonas oleivorans]|uniref:LysR family transcriptional regulator n=1 Tax=Sphingomonas oleivorans TaxID=1735121 RepID=A0A2T5FZR3_9SPHN|nr:LysR substrate-binding domain-containing protein [Sphingomonas oleivorans]PTQ12175.1 LysR family transcriptional regulator [Sphingomonas oleivorans]
MLNLNDLHLFVQAVESGGFAAAARRLGLPKSTISKRVGELEADLGVRLAQRTSRSFTLSDAGRDFYEHARAALIEAETAESIVRSRLAEPSGTVRITASVPVAQFYLADRLPAFVRTYPGLHVQLHATDRFVDLVQESFDIAVRNHFGPLPDSSLVQRQMPADPMVLVAAPAYLGAKGIPRRPEELARHDALLTSPSARSWRLRGEEGDEVEVTPRPVMSADESLLLLKAAADGLGIACLPAGFCRSYIARGELIGLLPGWTAGSANTTILVPHRRGQLPSVRAALTFLTEALSADIPRGG